MSYIRKISVGPNFPDGAVHYQFGNDVIYNRTERRKTHQISLIQERVNEKTGVKFFDIFIRNIPINGELVSEVLWKSVGAGLYTVVEYSIDFD